MEFFSEICFSGTCLILVSVALFSVQASIQLASAAPLVDQLASSPPGCWSWGFFLRPCLHAVAVATAASESLSARSTSGEPRQPSAATYQNRKASCTNGMAEGLLARHPFGDLICSRDRFTHKAQQGVPAVHDTRTAVMLRPSRATSSQGSGQLPVVTELNPDKAPSPESSASG